MPLALRLLRYLVLRPFLVFLFYFLVVALPALAPDSGGISALYLLILPWLFLLALLLHLPVLGAAMKGFRLPRETRINHALEHGTIFFLRRRCGKKYRIGGRAERDGFRLNGMPAPELITPAFRDLCEGLARRERRPVISSNCGSMAVTAQALSAVLLTIAALSFVLVDLERKVRAGILLAVLLLYLLMRHGLGRLLQRSLFVSLDFDDAQIHSIQQVKAQGPFERQPVYFVRTTVKAVQSGEP